MATLVFSTVGTVLGGPVGGAIGALIGQSVDQQILGPSSRGPRLGDLSVQSSSYGTQIPRVYGTMRIAGSVIWATDLVESSATTGAKGQPDTTFSYSVSFAVALSSRRVGAIKRIWADGKLLRGAEGDFKVSTTFRFYDGGEEQPVDPLIGSIEGVASTPAYRGLALAVFENLELAEFGNRIPFLTFELAADEEPPAIGAILGDAARGAIACEAGQHIGGYAAYGASIKAALRPIVDSYGIELFDDGSVVRDGQRAPAELVSAAELGNSADSQQAPRIQREQAPARALPAALRLSYYDPGRDYQSGEARGSASEIAGNEELRELPAVIDAAGAKSLVERNLARTWAARDKLTLRLPPRYLALEPGAVLALPLRPERWTVERCTIDGFVVVTELRPAWTPSVALLADAGRIAQSSDVVAGEVTLALFDVPDVLEQSSTQPTILLAASTPAPGWKSCAIEIDAASQKLAARAPSRKTRLGRALTVLAPGEPYLIDTNGSVEVELVDADQWLTSCDDAALAAGSNLAVLGRELIQFGEAAPTGPGRFRLGRLLRGRGGTEWAAQSHVGGEPFALIERDALRIIQLPLWVSGSTVTASIASGAVPASTPAQIVVARESVRALSPIHLTADLEAGGDLALSWTRRSRRGWAWIDEIDAPLGEGREEYRVTVVGSMSSIEFQTDEPALRIASAALASIGAGPTTIQVRQIGDWSASHPAVISLNLP